MTTFWRIDPDAARTVLVLGGLAARARRRLSAEVGSLSARPHPIPDLTGQPVEVIVDAVFAAISEAHSDQRTIEDPVSDGLCESCLALLELASRYGDPTGMAWPDPVRRMMAEVVDEGMAAQKA